MTLQCAPRRRPIPRARAPARPPTTCASPRQQQVLPLTTLSPRRCRLRFGPGFVHVQETRRARVLRRGNTHGVIGRAPVLLLTTADRERWRHATCAALQRSCTATADALFRTPWCARCAPA